MRGLTLSISSQCALLIKFLYSLIESLFHPRELETWSYKNMYTNVHSGIIHNYQKCKHPMSIWCEMDKQNGIYPNNGIVFSLKMKTME